MILNFPYYISLNFIKKKYSGIGLEVTASTGIASVNIGGSTIYSWAGIGLGNLPAQQIIENLFSARGSKARHRIKKTKILAIDEISMISANLLELLDIVFKAVRNSNLPMGGMQVLFFGDFLQLPPVNKGVEEVSFCFSSSVWKELNLSNIILKQIFRQQDMKFIKNFPSYTINEEAGYGNDYFVDKKEEKTQCYYFKIFI